MLVGGVRKQLAPRKPGPDVDNSCINVLTCQPMVQLVLQRGVDGGRR
jgi:hypothetical protein